MAETALASPIAVIGMAARFPGADDIDAFWSNLMAGKETIERTDGDGAISDPRAPAGDFVRSVGKVADVDLFDADHFRIPPAEAMLMDPQHRVLLEVAAAALDDAGHGGANGLVIGVFAGCGENTYYREYIAQADASVVDHSDAKVITGNLPDFVPARIAYKLGLTGPSLAVQATCSTSLTAIALACTALSMGDCDVALAGGVSLVLPETEGYTFAAGGIFSRDGVCRPFDAAASGTVPSSGAAMVVLRRDDEARASGDRRRAVVRGWATNNDGGSSAGFTAPSARGQEAVIRAALARAAVTPDEVGYVEAHGTATPIGDPIEFEALSRVFGASSVGGERRVLGAVKSNIGHTDAAAGAAGFIKAVLAVEGGMIPGTAHFETPNPAIDLERSAFQISAEPCKWPGNGPRVAGVSSFGLGGYNAHVVLEEAIDGMTRTMVRRQQVVALSARTEDELEKQRANLAAWLAAPGRTVSPALLADVGYTLSVGRLHRQYRWAASVSNEADLASALRAASGSHPPTLRWSLSVDGASGELAAMGRRLRHEEPLFKATLERLAQPFDNLEPPQAAALTVIAVLMTLDELGISIARVDAPRWALPAIAWMSGPRDGQDLGDTLAACSGDPGPAVPVGGASRLVVDKDFELPSLVARVWAGGAKVDWSRYYSVEARGRVGLPAYPYSRRSFWLSRPVREAREVGASLDAPSAPTTVGMRSAYDEVRSTWMRVLGLAELDDDAHFVDDLGGDSIYAVEVAAELSDLFGLDLPIDLPFTAPTVVNSTAYVEALLAHAAPGTDQVDAAEPL